MKKTKFLYIFPMISVVLLFAGCPIEGNQAILTIKNQSSLEITNITIWRGTEALEEAKLKMAEALLNISLYPTPENWIELAVATSKFDEEVKKTCSRSPELTDDTGLPISKITSWELNSGSLIVKATCGNKISSPYIVNFSGDHAVRFTGKNITNPDENEDDWE
jgi:hypothetical protein